MSDAEFLRYLKHKNAIEKLVFSATALDQRQAIFNRVSIGCPWLTTSKFAANMMLLTVLKYRIICHKNRSDAASDCASVAYFVNEKKALMTDLTLTIIEPVATIRNDVINLYRASARIKPSLSLLSLLVVLIASACSDGSNTDTFAVSGTDTTTVAPYLSGCADTQSCASNPRLAIDDARPAEVSIPSDYNTETLYPLVILLHGFGANGVVQSLYFGLNTRVDTQQFVLVTPDGTMNESGRRYWNATPSCCAGPDEEDQINDVAYIRGLIEKAAANYSIDTSRVGVIGHSNGGFMSLRMACEASDLVTSVVSLAGSTWEDAASCMPAEYPVSVLAMHGDEDSVIPYAGSVMRGFPSATETIARFAGLAGCDISNPSKPENINVDASIDGAETEILRYSGCAPGVDAELWTMVGSTHVPVPYAVEGMNSVVDWMIRHSRTN